MNLTKEEKDIILGHLGMSELYVQRDDKRLLNLRY